MKENHIYLLLVFLLLFSCNSMEEKSSKKEEIGLEAKTVRSKPPSTYQDTLVIDFVAAVFYHPDSLQLLKIQQVVDSAVYDATMHEYFYQMRNSRIVLNKYWPNIKIIDANNVRYLLFKKRNNETKVVDLDTKGDPHGLFLFDDEQDPEQADMMNIDTELPRYFPKKKLKNTS